MPLESHNNSLHICWLRHNITDRAQTYCFFILWPFHNLIAPRRTLVPANVARFFICGASLGFLDAHRHNRHSQQPETDNKPHIKYSRPPLPGHRCWLVSCQAQFEKRKRHWRPGDGRSFARTLLHEMRILESWANRQRHTNSDTNNNRQRGIKIMQETTCDYGRTFRGIDENSYLFQMNAYFSFFCLSF